MMTAASSFVAGNAQASAISNFQALSSSLPRAEMQVSHQQSRVGVTQEDVERGYVDVANASIFSVETSRGVGRYMVDLAVRGDDFSAASVEGLGFRVQLRSDGGATIMQPRHDLGHDLELSTHTAKPEGGILRLAPYGARPC